MTMVITRCQTVKEVENEAQEVAGDMASSPNRRMSADLNYIQDKKGRTQHTRH